MSNTASDNLHKLIKSLSKPEKRYFKVFSSRHILGENNNYLTLFDAIDRQTEYDEVKLLKKFKDQALINRFSIAKNRLYSAILRSLDSYHSNSSVQAQLHRQLHSVEILYQKSLYDQSLKLLHSAKKMAEKHEKLTILAEIHQWEKRILEKNNYEEADNALQIETMLQADAALAKNLQLFNELWNLKSKVFSQLYTYGKVRSEAELLRLKKMLDDSKEKLSSPVESTENEYLINHIYSAYYFTTAEYSQCYNYLTKNIALLDAKPHLFQDEPNVYFSVLTNAIHVGIRLGKWQDAQALIVRLNELPQKLEAQWNEDLQIRLFSLAKGTELTMLTQQGDFEKALILIPSIESGLKQYGDHLSSIRKAHFFFNMAVIFFGIENYKEALKQINHLLNEVEIDKTKDIHCIAQIFNLIIHLELGHKDLMPYALRSTQRFLETRKRIYKFESLMLRFVNELSKKRMDLTVEEQYHLLETELSSLKSDPFERTVFEYFDFLAWVRSKISGKKYRDLLAA